MTLTHSKQETCTFPRRLPWLILLLLSFLTTSFTACSSRTPSDIKALIQTIGADQLQNDATTLYRQLPEKNSFVPISKWPDSFHLMNPLQIRRTPNGILLILNKSLGKHSGVLIPASKKQSQPPTLPEHTSKATYTTLLHSIYWFDGK